MRQPTPTLAPTEIPWADGPEPAGMAHSDVLRALRQDDVRRRSFLRFVAGGAMGVGLAVLGWLPPARPQGAWAHCCLSEWAGSCRGFYSPRTTCVPESAKFSNTCTAGKWHRNDGGSGTCYNFKFTHYHTTCDTRNAWRWNSTRCSDGHYEYHDCGGGNVNTFSICRATV